MHENEDPWARAWASAREKLKADTPRRAAARAAFDASRPFKHEPVEQVRAVLVRELAARGIEDLTAEQLDVMVEAIVTSPTRTAVRHGIRGWRRIGRLLADAKRLSSPRWTETPQGITSVSEWRDDQEESSVVLRCNPASGDISAPDVVARLFADLPNVDADEEEDDEPRGCSYWMSIDPPGRGSNAVNVHIGKFVIAQLRGEVADAVSALIAEHGGERRAIRSFAEVYGSDPESGSIKLYFPDRP